ncbi:MAG: hypothetical protein D6757_07375 [Alphaproteobacteria bacterium]|nr:MAG: hypothetical protein D6757_07375 [Alphaproteobacteria bacterium]
MNAVTALMISTIVLWCAVVALAFVVLALMRQIGALHDRIRPVGALSLSGGLKPGQAVPPVVVHDVAQHPVSVSGEAEDGRARLLVFTAPNCPVCAELKETLAAIARQERDWLAVIQVSDGPLAEHEAAARASHEQGIPYVLSRNLGLLLEVGRLPYAALIDAQGVLKAKGLVNSREHLESLFEAHERAQASLQDWLAARLAAGRE